MSEAESGAMQETALRFFGGLAKSYERLLDLATVYQDRRWKAWAEQWIPSGESRVLDLGCGTLLLEERMAGLKPRFVGLDLTFGMIRVGRMKELHNVELLVNGDAEGLPFPAESFDCIVSCYVPKYVNLRKLADELARVAKPGSTVVLYDFARPRGAYAPFLELYIQGGLRIAGRALRMRKSPAADVFERLPEIIDGTDWDHRVVGLMEERGFRTLVARPLTGGAVFAYCGRKSAIGQSANKA